MKKRETGIDGLKDGLLEFYACRKMGWASGS